MIKTSDMPIVELDKQNLPAYCPNPLMPLWSSHPRVYLAVEEGIAQCPYCSTRYQLKNTPENHCNKVE